MDITNLSVISLPFLSHCRESYVMYRHAIHPQIGKVMAIVYLCPCWKTCIHIPQCFSCLRYPRERPSLIKLIIPIFRGIHLVDFRLTRIE